MRALALLTARQGVRTGPSYGGPMSINISAILGDDTEAARKRAVTEVVDGLRGSQILAIATAVRAMQAEEGSLQSHRGRLQAQRVPRA